ncbi:MAG: hypothetical protein ACRDJM_07150 [Actinomycetota bacterium]
MGDPAAPPLQAGQLFRVLDEHEVRYVVVGGLAAVVHGAGRVTFDIDVVPKWTTENLSRLADALAAVGARLRVPGGAEPVEYPLDAKALRAFELSTWRTAYGDIDVIRGTPTTVKGRLAGYAALARRAHAREAFGVTVFIADLDDVIESKQVLAREPDLAALPELHRLRDRLARRRHHEPQDPPTR